jgi:hypothetical protein
MTNEKAWEVLDQAEKVGLVVRYDAGFLVVSRSVSADRGRDAAAVEQSIFIEIGKSLKDVFSLAIRSARSSSAKDFMDCQVFVPGHQLIGKFTGYSESGIVTVTYRADGPNRISNFDVVELGAAEDFFILVPCDERPDQPSFSWMAVDEKVRLLFERAELAGVSLEHDRGFTVAKCGSIGDVDKTIRQLGKSMSDVSRYTLAKSIARHGAGFVGQRVWVPELHSFGVLASSADDGGLLEVSYREKHSGSDLTSFCRADRMLVILVAGGDEEADSKPAAPKKENWIRRTFGGSA